jgi:hypothetical protein
MAVLSAKADCTPRSADRKPTLRAQLRVKSIARARRDLAARKVIVRGPSDPRFFREIRVARRLLTPTARPPPGRERRRIMLSHTYSYEQCLHNSLKVAWKEEDVLQNRDFDYSKRFLPNRLAGVDEIVCLDESEKLKLNQIIGNAYCHIFAFVEEFIVPQALEEAQRDVYGEEARLRALIRFAEDEIKHQQMFRRSMALFEKGFGTPCGVIPGREDVARVVLGKSRLCSLLLTSMIEWFTQVHYVEHVRADEQLDGLFRDLIKYHWIDEATHAKLDSLVINEIVGPLSLAEREHAIDELLELGGAIDGLLSQQADLDIESLQRATGRIFADHERAEIKRNIQRAYRWTFLVSGLRHPTFAKIVGELTEEGPRRLEMAAAALSA